MTTSTSKIHDFKRWATNHKGEDEFFFYCCGETSSYPSRNQRDNALDKHILRSRTTS